MVSISSSTSDDHGGGVTGVGDEFIPLSALQHYLFCPRQCALIHVEGQWIENRYTAEGQILHRRTDEGRSETRHGVRTVTSMPIRSSRLGVTGVADVVEFHTGRVGENDLPGRVQTRTP